MLVWILYTCVHSDEQLCILALITAHIHSTYDPVMTPVHLQVGDISLSKAELEYITFIIQV